MENSIDLDQLASDLVTHGVEANEHALARLAHEARDTGASPVAVAVLGDRGEPWPARVRAFIVVDRHLRRTAPTLVPSAA